MDPIKQRIIELVPEIMELKFGCQVLFKDIVFNYVCRGKEGRSPTLMLITPDGERATVVIAEMEKMKYEILGRPIQLADVLLALQSQTKWDVFVMKNGNIVAMGESSVRWNLLETYDNQTQDVKNFIGRLLGISNVTG